MTTFFLLLTLLTLRVNALVPSVTPVPNYQEDGEWQERVLPELVGR